MSLLDDMAADIAGEHVFYDTDSGFGIVTAGAAGGFTIIFDNEYISYGDDGAPLVASEPRGWCRTSEAPALGAYFTVVGVSYVVRNREPNADGETYLTLHQQADPS